VPTAVYRQEIPKVSGSGPADDAPMETKHEQFWRGRDVLVTGGAGFIGSHLAENLDRKGARVRVLDNFESGSQSNLAGFQADFRRGDLFDRDTCEESCGGIDVVFNLAAKVAGVGYNVGHQADMFYRNSVLNLNMLEAARRKDVDRYVVVSSACVYEREATVPTVEEHGFNGDPEPTNLGYGWAKRLAEVQARVYADQYGMKISIVRPYNTYGPRDHFDDVNGHVIPTLIRKIWTADKEVNVWGNGQQRRSFVYIDDLVRGLLLSPELHPVPDPVNIGSDEEASIGEVVKTLVRISGKRLQVRFDESKPSGQNRRLPDLSKARKLLGYSPKVSLEEGLANTVRWYESHRGARRVAPVASR